MITIVLADDHEELRGMFRRQVEEEPDFEIVAEAASREEALAHCEMLQPALLLSDFRMPEMRFLTYVAQLRASCPRTKLLIMSAEYDPFTIEFMEEHADGYLYKGQAVEELAATIRRLVGVSPT